jgi:hypothetical protein
VATKIIERFVARAVRLYEQEREEPCGSPLLGLYVKRWRQWLWARIRDLHINSACSVACQWGEVSSWLT